MSFAIASHSRSSKLHTLIARSKIQQTTRWLCHIRSHSMVHVSARRCVATITAFDGRSIGPDVRSCIGGGRRSQMLWYSTLAESEPLSETYNEVHEAPPEEVKERSFHGGYIYNNPKPRRNPKTLYKLPKWQGPTMATRKPTGCFLPQWGLENLTNEFRKTAMEAHEIPEREDLRTFLYNSYKKLAEKPGNDRVMTHPPCPYIIVAAYDDIEGYRCQHFNSWLQVHTMPEDLPKLHIKGDLGKPSYYNKGGWKGIEKQGSGRGSRGSGQFRHDRMLSMVVGPEGKGVTWSQFYFEIAEWLYGENAEVVVPREYGTAALIGAECDYALAEYDDHFEMNGLMVWLGLRKKLPGTEWWQPREHELEQMDVEQWRIYDVARRTRHREAEPVDDNLGSYDPPRHRTYFNKTFYEWGYWPHRLEEVEVGGENGTGHFIDAEGFKAVHKEIMGLLRGRDHIPESDRATELKGLMDAVAQIPEFDRPIANPPMPYIFVHAADEQLAGPVSPVGAPHNLPQTLAKLRIDAKEDAGGKGVTFKQILEEVGEWIHGSWAETIVAERTGTCVLSRTDWLMPADNDSLLGMEISMYFRDIDDYVAGEELVEGDGVFRRLKLKESKSAVGLPNHELSTLKSGGSRGYHTFTKASDIGSGAMPQPLFGSSRSRSYSTTSSPTNKPQWGPPRNPKTRYSIDQADYPGPAGILADYDFSLFRSFIDEIVAITHASPDIDTSAGDIKTYYRKSYKRLVLDPKWNIPIGHSHLSFIYIITVDEQFEDLADPTSDHGLGGRCPCCLTGDTPTLRVEAPDGENLTYTHLIEQVGDWLYGDQPEEVVKGRVPGTGGIYRYESLGDVHYPNGFKWWFYVATNERQRSWQSPEQGTWRTDGGRITAGVQSSAK